MRNVTLRNRFRRTILLAALALPLGSALAALDRIIVVVNEGVVLESELDTALAEARQQLEQRGIELPPASTLRSQVLERLVLTRLQTQRARDAGIRVSDQELNRVLTGLAERNGLTLAEFAVQLRSRGIDYLGVREQVRDELLISRLRQREVEARVNVSDRDIELFLSSQTTDDNSEYRLQHILVSVPDGASPVAREKAREKAEALRARINEGEDFAQLAVAHSDGQQALQGGDLDWRSAEELPSLFVDVARSLAIDGVSDVLEAASGYHIIKLAELRGGEPRQIVQETKVRHILISPNAIRDDEDARLLIERLRQELVEGGDFKELAEEHSDDPGSKNDGGELGWQPTGVFAPEFQLKIDQLRPNELSTPFRTQFGWHIAEVLDRRERDATEQARRARAREALRNRKVAEEYEIWLRRLRDEAYVEYRLAEDQARADAG